MITFDTVQFWFWEWLFSYSMSVAVTLLIYYGYKWFRWGGWKVIIYDENGDIWTERTLSIRKAESIEDESDRSVFLKGMCSPYKYLDFDLINQGIQCGFLKINNRTITMDFRNYPTKEQKPKQTDENP
jgi:hypothetical protein